MLNSLPSESVKVEPGGRCGIYEVEYAAKKKPLTLTLKTKRVPHRPRKEKKEKAKKKS